jgi:hypothetical protein
MRNERIEPRLTTATDRERHSVRRGPQQSDPRGPANKLLRPRGERPRSRCTAEYGNKFSSSDADCH